jgi:hypothetical protein
METGFGRATTALRIITLIAALSAALATHAHAAASSIIFGNASSREAAVVVDRTYKYHAPPTHRRRPWQIE